MNQRSFYDVFPKIELEGIVHDLFERVLVDNVSQPSDRSKLRIYISSENLITYQQLCTVKRSIKKQVFGGGGPEILLFPKFHLSAQYDLSNLYDIYKESIFAEVYDRSRVLHDLLSNAKVEFPAKDTMMLTFEEGSYIEKRVPELEDILNRIFTDRCGLEANIIIKYDRAVKEDYGKGWTGSWVGPVIDPDSLSHVVPGAEPPGPEVRDNEEKEAQNEATPRPEKRNPKIKPLRHSDNPDVIYGRDITEDAIPISDLQGEIGDCVIRGMVTGVETKQIKGERTIATCVVTDFEDSIKFKLFVHNEQFPELAADLKKGAFIKVQGKCLMDSWDKELELASVSGIKTIPDFRTHRHDTASVKRVELHCHTKMSELDGVSDCSSLVKRAYEWGMPALAITDHGVVQGFTDAYHTWCDLWDNECKKRKAAGDEAPDKQDFFKIIYGVEAYLVDDLRKIVNGDTSREIDSQTYVVFDLETTGFSPVHDEIIEIGAVKIRGGEIIDRFSTFVDPKRPIPFRIEQLTSISDAMVMGQDTVDIALPKFLDFIGGDETVLVGHNVEFDVSFIREKMKTVLGLDCPYTYADTLGMSRALLTGHKKYTLDAVAKM
ncbi:MAG: PHP domain-containing protein, partial [Lachnospiraceae bacterium]|nr:PHP domain-containing protein [Lachnospiraceae bacterium]